MAADRYEWDRKVTFPKPPSADHLRLHLGELSPDEARIAQAAYRLALAESGAKGQVKGPAFYVNRVFDCGAGEDRGEIATTLPANLIGKRVRLVPIEATHPQAVTPAGGEVGSLRDAILALQEWQPNAQKNKAASRGFVAYMQKKPATCEGDAFGFVNLGDVLDVIATHPPVADAALARLEGMARRWVESAQNDKHEQRASSKQKCASDLRALMAALKQRGGDRG